jgi:hypothetical protein
MGELADRIHVMRVRASTPDGGITAELRDRDEVSLAFREGLYDLCDDGDLERRLAALANLLWVARTREYWRVFGEVTGDYSTGEDKPLTARDADWRTERDALVATGSSAGGRIKVRAIGMRRWEVNIRPGTVRTMDERQFALAAGQAAGELIRDQFAKVAALSHKYYGDDR